MGKDTTNEVCVLTPQERDEMFREAMSLAADSNMRVLVPVLQYGGAAMSLIPALAPVGAGIQETGNSIEYANGGSRTDFAIASADAAMDAIPGAKLAKLGKWLLGIGKVGTFGAGVTASALLASESVEGTGGMPDKYPMLNLHSNDPCRKVADDLVTRISAPSMF